MAFFRLALGFLVVALLGVVDFLWVPRRLGSSKEKLSTNTCLLGGFIPSSVGPEFTGRTAHRNRGVPAVGVARVASNGAVPARGVCIWSMTPGDGSSPIAGIVSTKSMHMSLHAGPSPCRRGL